MSQRQNDKSIGRKQSKGSGKQSGSSSVKRARIAALPTDIICGRGFHIVNHRGNLNLHLIVNGYRDEYTKSRRSEKTKITKHILKDIKGGGTRFIRKVVSDGRSHADEWEEVDDATAYKKVSHALRLRTTNESNRDNGPISAGAPAHDEIGNSIDEALSKRTGVPGVASSSSSAPSDDKSADGSGKAL